MVRTFGFSVGLTPSFSERVGKDRESTSQALQQAVAERSVAEAQVQSTSDTLEHCRSEKAKLQDQIHQLRVQLGSAQDKVAQAALEEAEVGHLR